ncbi:MAG: DUF4249 family protein [Bacteroidota bacterium]
MNKKSYLKLLALVLAVGCFLTACLDKIDLELQAGLDEGLVLRGELIKGEPSTLVVRINRIFNFELSTLSPINARSVVLIDEAGNQLDIKSKADGLHEYTFNPLVDPIQIETGGKYKIRVSMFDGRVYESALEEILPTPETGQLKTERTSVVVLNENNEPEEIPRLQFLIDAPVELKGKERNARLQWIPKRTYEITDSALIFDFVPKTCYITQQLDFDNIHVLDGTQIEETAMDFPLSKVPINFEFAQGYYYTVYQRSLTKGAFDHWQQTKQVVERTGNLFEPPAGRIESNFENVEDPNDISVFGYFAAFEQDTLRLYISPEELNFPARECPRAPVMGDPCPVITCCDCLGAEGSQLAKPDFWEK